jgi:uncharacterized phage-associated protein
LSEAYNVPITNLSLQKLLFFIQGFHYLNYDKLLFEEEIEAWNFGPVIPEIYHQFKKFGKNPITEERACYFEPSMNEASFPEIKESLYPEAFKMTNDTFALLAGKDPFKLVWYIHLENSPWTALVKTDKKGIYKIEPHLKIEIQEKDKEYFKSVYDEVKAEYDEWESKQI